MIESRPIPTIAMLAYEMTMRECQRALQTLGRETVAVLGLNEADGWTVNFETGEMTRHVSDASAGDGGSS